MPARWGDWITYSTNQTFYRGASNFYASTTGVSEDQIPKTKKLVSVTVEGNIRRPGNKK